MRDAKKYVRARTSRARSPKSLTASDIQGLLTDLYSVCRDQWACWKLSGARGGGGGVLRFGSDGGVPLKPPKTVPIFKGHFGGNGYPLLGVWWKRVPIIQGFLFKKMTFLCTLATKWAKISSIYSKITKVGGHVWDFFGKSGGHV